MGLPSSSLTPPFLFPSVCVHLSLSAAKLCLPNPPPGPRAFPASLAIYSLLCLCLPFLTLNVSPTSSPCSGSTWQSFVESLPGSRQYGRASACCTTALAPFRRKGAAEGRGYGRACRARAALRSAASSRDACSRSAAAAAAAAAASMASCSSPFCPAPRPAAPPPPPP